MSQNIQKATRNLRWRLACVLAAWACIGSTWLGAPHWLNYVAVFFVIIWANLAAEVFGQWLYSRR